VRHVQVEDEQVRADFGEAGDGVARIGDAGHVLTARVGEQAVEHPHVGPLVVDDEDSGCAQHVSESNHAQVAAREPGRLSHACPSARPWGPPGSGAFVRARESTRPRFAAFAALLIESSAVREVDG
jgi:hypothetical protein